MEAILGLGFSGILWFMGNWSFAKDGLVMVKTSGFIVIFGCLRCFVGYEVFGGDNAWELLGCWLMVYK
jgi:hypothetical protein